MAVRIVMLVYRQIGATTTLAEDLQNQPPSRQLQESAYGQRPISSCPWWCLLTGKTPTRNTERL